MTDDHDRRASSSLRIGLLGGFRVEVDAREVDRDAWRLRKARSLVKLLALTPGHRLHREQLMDVLWPDLDPRAAANQLRKAVHAARTALSPDPEGRRATILRQDDLLALPAGTVVDVEELRADATRGRRTGDLDAYRAAITAYEGDLLPDDLYEEWASATREELRREFVALAIELSELLESRAELEEAAATLRRALGVDPGHEAASRALMRVHAVAGRRTDALHEYERLTQVLDRELGVEPDLETTRLFERIRGGQPLETDLRADLWEQVGDLRHRSGDAVGAVAAFESALGGGEETVRLHRKAAAALLMVHDWEQATGHLDVAERIVAAHPDPAELGRLLAVRANWLWERGSIEEAGTAAEEARRLAERHGDPGDLAAAHEALATVLHFKGEWREGLRREIDRMSAEVDTEAQLGRIFDIHHCIGEYHLYGDVLFDSVEDYARQVVRIASRSAARRAEAFGWCLLGESMLLRGRWDEAAGPLERAGEIHAELGESSGALAWQRLGELAVCRGNLDVAATHVRRGMTIATVSPMARHVWGRLYATQAFGALEAGDPSRAADAARAAAAASTRYGDCATCDALLHPLAAEAFHALGDAPGAELHAEIADRTAGMWESSAWRAMAITARAFHRATLGDADAAARGLRKASALYDRAGQPYWAERTRRRADDVA